MCALQQRGRVCALLCAQPGMLAFRNGHTWSHRTRLRLGLEMWLLQALREGTLLLISAMLQSMGRLV